MFSPVFCVSGPMGRPRNSSLDAPVGSKIASNNCGRGLRASARRPAAQTSRAMASKPQARQGGNENRAHPQSPRPSGLGQFTEPGYSRRSRDAQPLLKQPKTAARWMLALTGIDIEACPRCGHRPLQSIELPPINPHHLPPRRGPPDTHTDTTTR